MRSLIFIIFVMMTSVGFATDPVTKIAKANKAKDKAEEAFKAGEYEKAIAQYGYLLDSLNVQDDAALLNKAHAYFHMSDTLNAFEAYREASMSAKGAIKSTAMNQLGALSEMQEQNKQALDFYKEALRANPYNKEARYNYELLKKKMEEQEQNKQDQKNQDQQNQDEQKQDQQKQDQQKKEDQEKSQEDQQSEDQEKGEEEEQKQEGQESEEKKDKQNADQENKSEEQKEGEQQEQQSEEQQNAEEQKQQEDQKNKEGEENKMEPSTKEKLEAMNVSEEKAKMILEALRNKEAQYLQQMRKKPTKRKDSGKPDW